MTNVIEDLEKNWHSLKINIDACVDLWNSYSDDFSKKSIPTFKDNEFMKLLKQNDMLKKDGSCLDIGCGTGRYTIALFKEFKNLVGIDIADGMIEKANIIAKEKSAENINFVCSQWDNVDLNSLNNGEKFDLVFAHMTPAINSLSSFKKIIDASKGYCVMSKPTKRVDVVMDKIVEKLDVKGFSFSAEDDILNAFNYLWINGYKPQFHYEINNYKTTMLVENAVEMYESRIKQYKDLSDKDKSILREIVCSFSNGDEFNQDMQMQVTTIYWHV